MSEKTPYMPGTKPLLIMFLMGIVALFSLTIGKRRANAETERLEVLWPNLAQMHEQEKMVLLQASARCRLIRLPMPVSREDVTQCLERGAIKENRAMLKDIMKRARHAAKE